MQKTIQLHPDLLKYNFTAYLYNIFFVNLQFLNTVQLDILKYHLYQNSLKL